MKRYLFILLALFAVGARAQTDPVQQPFKTVYGEIQFTTPFYELENSWAVLARHPQNNKAMFGMVYMDNAAGFSFRIEGTFQIDAEGKVFRDSTDYLKNQALTSRIGNGKLAAIPAAMLADLKVPAEPAWLAIYQPVANRNTDAYKITHGRFLNAAKVPAKALTYLEPVYKTNPHAPGLEFELSYAYNVLGRYAEAEALLKSAIEKAPNDNALYSELGYAYRLTKNYTKATDAYLYVLKLTESKKDDFFRLAAITNLLLLYNEQKQYDKTIALLTDYLAGRYDIQAYLSLVAAYAAKGNFEDAAKSYIKGIEASPSKEMQNKAQLAYLAALLYRDKLNNLQQYTYWGKKAKEWAPTNTPVAKAANALVFMGE